MPTFSQSDIIRFFNQGEVDASNDCNFLIDRYEIPVLSTVHTYQIPDYIRGISRVTFQGKKLTPLPRRDLNGAFQPATQQGRPFWYVFNNVGQNKIRLFPTPNDATPVGNDPWCTDIPTATIVEFFRISDNDQFILPDWCRNYLLKKYCGRELFSIEGPGQNLKMAKYMAQQWQLWYGEFQGLIDELHNAPRKLFVSDVVSGNWFPGSPVLPIDKFGISVDTGY
jgi:hypothetical protein